jgi:hypothetical protein
MFLTHEAAFKGWQQVLLGGRGNSGRGLGSCVCRRVLTRSNGVTGGVSKISSQNRYKRRTGQRSKGRASRCCDELRLENIHAVVVGERKRV